MKPSGQFNTTNYMVPSNGQTHAIVFQGQFSSVPAVIDWRQYAIDNQKFQPQGAYIDNSAGTVPLTITILPIGYNVICPAGQVVQTQFPAPNGQTATITGDPANTATVIFVDFPVLPSSTQASILNTVQTNIASVTPGVRIGTDPNPLAAGNTLPYRTQEYVSAPEFHALSIAPAATTVNVVPTVANQNLRKLQIAISGDAAKAAAGIVTVTATLNGVLIFSKALYLNAAAATNVLNYDVCNLEFNDLAPPAAAGNLTIALSAALTTGTVSANAYFTPQ